MTQISPNRRAAPRRRTLMGCSLRFAARTGTMSCVVRNLSANGAMLAMENPLWLPDSFEVDIPHQNLRLAAKVVWRAPDAMGVAFDAPAPVALPGEQPSTIAQMPARPAFASRSEQDRLSFLEQERARLEARVRQLTEEF